MQLSSHLLNVFNFVFFGSLNTGNGKTFLFHYWLCRQVILYLLRSLELIFATRPYYQLYIVLLRDLRYLVPYCR